MTLGRDLVDKMAELASSGMSQKETAEQLHVSYAWVRANAQKNGIKFRHGNKRTEIDGRAKQMLALYEDGRTLAEIGDAYGLTRERVRQIMTRSFGTSAADGGQHCRAEKKRRNQAAREDAKCHKKHGCTVEQYRSLKNFGRELHASGIGIYRTPTRAFCSQRANAARRGIGWELKLWEWWSIWLMSERWGQRGRGQGYVMCRIRDEGPYAVGNVFIALAAENSSERTGRKTKLPRGVSKARNRFVAKRMFHGKVYHLGSFPTPDQAYAAYLSAEPREAA